MIDGILAVTHPDLYQSSQVLMEKITRDHDQSRGVMPVWPTCFTSVQIIVNRLSLRHRDISGIPGWFDLLLSLGTYGETAVLELRGLGISLPYDSGTIVPISSKLVMHGVPAVPRDRVCYAFYMSREIFKSFKVPAAGMAKIVHVFPQEEVVESPPRVTLIDEQTARRLGHVQDYGLKGSRTHGSSTAGIEGDAVAFRESVSDADDVLDASMPLDK